MYDQYIKCIQRQLYLEPVEWNFKRHEDYNGILEHVSESLANQYLTEIKNRFKIFYETYLETLIEISIRNDLFGNTIKCNFSNFRTCSPSNLRYICILF